MLFALRVAALASSRPSPRLLHLCFSTQKPAYSIFRRCLHTQPISFTRHVPPSLSLSTHASPPVLKPGFISRLLPVSFHAQPASASSFRKIMALARPERKPLLIAVGLLLLSSSVSMSIPFTIGRLIDYFTSSEPVRIRDSRCQLLTDFPRDPANTFGPLPHPSVKSSSTTLHSGCRG